MPAEREGPVTSTTPRGTTPPVAPSRRSARDMWPGCSRRGWMVYPPGSVSTGVMPRRSGWPLMPGSSPIIAVSSVTVRSAWRLGVSSANASRNPASTEARRAFSSTGDVVCMGLPSCFSRNLGCVGSRV